MNDKPPCDWPNLQNETRAKIYALVKAAGVDPDGKWLSECVIQAFEKLGVKLPEQPPCS